MAATKKTKTTTTTTTNQTGRRWNELPEDLVGEIMVRLSSSDRIRFAACCHNFWSSISDYNNPETDQLPWLVKAYFNYSSIANELELFDPIHKSQYSRTCIEEITGQSKFCKHRIQLLASKHGWLLSSLEKHIDPYVKMSFVLVSPFTKQFIILPDLTVGEKTKSAVAAFSAEPLAPDCSYFLLRQSHGDHYIRRYRSGDNEWKTIKIQYGVIPCGVAYHEGSLYYFTPMIHRYDVVHDKCYVGDAKVSKSFRTKYDRGKYNQHTYFLTCEGKLLLVYLYVPLRNGKKKDRCLVFEYSEQRQWVEQRSLGDHALFLCPCGSFSVLTSSEVTTEIANRIYYYRPDYDGKKHYYSLKDDKSYPCESSYWPGIETSGTWIEPPQLQATRRSKKISQS